MELKSLKVLFLLICILDLSLSQYEEYDLDTTSPIQGNGDKTFLINLKSDKTYKDYISITLETQDDSHNPMIFVSSNNQKCQNDRLYTGVQIVAPILIFLKKSQIKNNKFYICVRFRDKLDSTSFQILLKNEDKAYIPYNSQVSYFISDENVSEMDFIFKKNDTLNSKKTTFWIRGRDIKILNTLNNFKKFDLDSGYIYYGDYINEDIVFQLKSNIGDFITIGNAIISEKKLTYELKENANEISIATEGEVCLPISFEKEYINHITGKIFTYNAKTYFRYENGTKIEKDGIIENRITNGILSDINIGIFFSGIKNMKGLYCLESLNNKHPLVIFSIQMTSNKNYQMVHPPLVPGEIRRHFLMKNEYAIFYGMKPEEGATEVNLNVKALKGFPEMYFDKCKTFPECSYSKESIEKEKLIHPYPSNMMTVYSFYINEEPEYKTYNPFSTFQPLMIVYCGPGGKKDFFGESAFCEFDKSFFTNNDTINIYQDSSFTQYLLKDEIDEYKIHLNIGNADRLFLDMLIFSGDADLRIENCPSECNKYYLSNKIFYSIHIDENSSNDIFTFNVIATEDVFYMIQYKLIDSNSIEENILESGINHIIPQFINSDSMKITKRLKLMNYKVEFEQSYLATFFSPNCKFSIKHISKKTEKIAIFDNSGQIIINSTGADYHKGEYTFDVMIDETSSEYKNTYCMLYASGLELTKGTIDEWNGRSISLSEGVPHRYTFSPEYPLIFYAYHISSKDKTAVINFNLIDKAYFNITLKVGRQFLKNETIYRNSQLYIKKEELEGKCEDQEVCTIIIIVHLFNSNRERKVELTVYQIDDNPFYLEKNAIKQDIIHGNYSKHYYFDIGKGDYGDITLDFKRGSGNIYAAVVKRYLEKPMDNPDWRGLYHFPTRYDKNTLPFKYYSKKIIIEKEDTNECDDGCYVLISIISNVEYKDEDEDDNKNKLTPFRISIIPRIMNQDTQNRIPSVRMYVNEFVIGDIEFAPSDERKYDYYIVTLPYESEYVIFDWQADSPALIINIGETKPEIGNSDFKFPQANHDYVYKLSKEEIIQKAGSTITSLRGLDLTIGIYSNTSDSVQISPYAFKIFMPPTVDKDLHISDEIIHIRGDQKVQCLPFNYNNTKICVFALIIDDFDIGHSMIIYPRSQKGYPLTLYGNLFDAEKIERNDINEINKIIENIYLKEEYKVNQKYIYLNNILDKTKSYVFISLLNEYDSIIEVLSSSYSYFDNVNLYPNPSTVQLFATKDYNITLNFITTKDLLINLVSITGLGNFYWDTPEEKQKIYYLSGFNDRISLISSTKKEQTSKLNVQSFKYKDKLPDIFIFYVTFYPRTDLDQLKKDTSTEIYYRESKLPFTFYTPIDLNNSWTINFNFYDYDLDADGETIYELKPFNFWATILNSEDVLRARFDPNFRPKYSEKYCLYGIFDFTFGTLFLNKKDIQEIYEYIGPKEHSLENPDYPNIYINIDSDTGMFNSTSINLELSILSNNDSNIYNTVQERVYISGKITDSVNKKFIYMLQYDKNRPFFQLEFSTNYNLIKFAVSVDPKSEITDSFKKMKIIQENGKTILTIELDNDFYLSNENLYLIVFTKEINISKKLGYYIFKYFNTKNELDLVSLLDKSINELNVEQKDNNYQISFYAVNNTENIDSISYYIKAVYYNSSVQDENIDTIAISESEGKYIQLDNPEINEESKILYSFNCNEKLSYIKVMVKINSKADKVFYSYKPYEFLEKKDNVSYLNKTNSIIYIPYNFTSNYVEAYVHEAYKVQKYWLLYAEGVNKFLKDPYLPNYINIKATHKDKTKPSPIIDFFHTESDGTETRLQLAKGGADYTELWIKREQFISIGLYFSIECYSEYNCGYNIYIKGFDEINIDTKRAYSYYVRQENKILKFRIDNEYKSEKSYMTIYATGEKEISFSSIDCQKADTKSSDSNNGVTTLIASGIFDYCIIEISASINDYITIGAKTTNNQNQCSEDTLNYYNELIIGYLNKDILQKECYILPKNKNDLYYISLTFYDKIGDISLFDDNPQLIGGESFAKNDKFYYYIYNPQEKNLNYMCINLPNSEDILTYGIRLQSKNHFLNNYNPQITGKFYQRIIPTDTYAYFIHKTEMFSSLKMIFNMITLEGYPKMYIYNCKTYPSCELDYSSLEQIDGVERSSEINRVSSLIKSTSIQSPIEKDQNLLIIKCNNGRHDKYNYCNFMTLFFTNGQHITLLENQPFGQYISQNENYEFYIDFSQDIKEGKTISKIHIDFLVVNGDASFELENPDKNEDIISHKYYLSNKIFYSITKNETLNKDLQRIFIKAKARINSYITIEYRLIQQSSDENYNNIFSSINYLLPIFINDIKDNKKYISIKHVNIIKPKSFITSFYSLNCEIDVIKHTSEEDKGLYSLSNYAQDFFVVEDYDNNYFNNTYSIEVQNMDSTYLDEKHICMVYISALEIYEKNSGIRKEILISEGVPQRVIYENDLDIMRYLFTNPDNNKNIALNINMIVKGKFKVKIFFRESMYNQEEIISKSTYFFINREWIQEKCRPNELCTMTVEIEKIRSFYETDPILEITVKQTENEPYYISKGIIKKDFLSGDKYLRLYTDIGKNEGYITVNFYRGSGYIYAKIVEINQKDPDVGADWRNYKFPDKSDNKTTLKYDFYNKKILITEEDTKNCDLGCYVLISIKTSVMQDEFKESDFYPFSIIVEFSPKDYINKNEFQRKIIIDPEEYIIGSLYETDDVNKTGIYEYYTISLPYDVSGVEIDWQSDTAELLINVGQERPLDNKRDFHFDKRKDTNIFISKNSIINAFGGVEGQSLQGISLVFGVYTKYYNSIYSTIYSFRVHFPVSKLNIYKINSDHKTICSPEKVDYNYYRCLFMFSFATYETFNDLIVYAKSQSPSAILYIYGNEINSEIYNSYNIEQLKENIPDEITAKYNPRKEKKNFIFLSFIDTSKNLFISVISDKNDMIELYSSTKTWENTLSPNPSSAQIYSINKNKDKLNINFITTKSFSINIHSLYGEANIYLQDKPDTTYYLQGVEDNLELYVPQNTGGVNSMLVIENMGKNGNYSNIGFAFILEYHLRSYMVNIDEIKIDETSEISYKEADFPIYFFSKIFDYDKSINIFFNLHNSIYTSDEYFSRKLASKELIIKGTILNENMIYEIQKDASKIPELSKLEIEGIYDSVIQVGNMVLSKEFIMQKFVEKPILFLAIEKNKNIEQFFYKSIRGEIGISTINGDAPVTQKLYQFGKIKDYYSINSYKLKSDSNTKYMRIQFSANSKYVNFAINQIPDTRINMTLVDMSYKRQRGITFITFQKPNNLDYIYINIFLAQNSSDSRLNNYIFKYINADSIDKFYEYKIINNNHKIRINKGNKNVKATINQIDISSDSENNLKTSIIYVLKLYTSKYISQENINMISISESEIISKQFNHQKDSKEITLDLDYDDDTFKYIQVIAKITQGAIIEYISYEAVDYDGKDITDPEPVDINIPKPVLSYEEINFDSLVNPIMGTKDTSYHIILSNNNYKNYFYIRVNSFEPDNPYVFISTNDKDCKNNRIYMTSQIKDTIIIFLKKEQVNKEFYICVKNKKDLFEYKFEISLENDNQALIPFYSQTSYLVTKDNINMEFTYKEDLYLFNKMNMDEEKDIINFWVKGKKDINVSINNDSGLKKLNYEDTYIFYGEKKSNEIILSIQGKEGDYITVGINGINYALEENQNELIMASENEVCLPIPSTGSYLMHLTGQIYTRKAISYFKDFSGKKIDITETEIDNGIISDVNFLERLFDSSRGYYCLKSNNNNNQLIAFAIQMTTHRNYQLVHPPLVPGEIRRHFLMKNEYAIFYGMKPENGATEVNLNIKALKGFPEMYYDECTTFPECSYSKESIEKEKLIHPYPSNMMTVYSFYIKGEQKYKAYNPITTFQPLMIVHCDEGGKIDDFFSEDIFCEFETSFFTNKDTININEDNTFSQYLIKGEEDKYEIILDKENCNLLYLDLMIFSGDVNIIIDNFDAIKNKYYLSNKIFYSIHLNDTHYGKSLEFKVKANINSFYMIQYKLISKNSKDSNTIESGVNYITSKYIDNNSEEMVKHIELINYKYEFDQSYLVNFYSPNCIFGVKLMNQSEEIEEISVFGNYVQKIIKPNDSYYYQEKYQFEYYILVDDDSSYNKKFCMVYASGLELTENQNEWNGRSITLSEGVPHRVIFNEDNHFVSYAYHISDIQQTVVLNFNLIDKDYFTINLYINKKPLNIDTSILYRNGQLYIYNKDLKELCEVDEVCTVIIGVQLENFKREKKLELTVYQIDDNPFYLEKNVIKQDIIHGNKVKHYYFDVGKGDYGDITLDFKRGSGNIYVSVVKRNLEKPMDNPDWRNVYHFPTKEESLQYETYIKKILIGESDTHKCDDGCYVLISIVSNLDYNGSDDNELIPYRISINPRILKGDIVKNMPKVKINVNDFVIGEIEPSSDKYNIYDYYTVTLPYESPYLLIDWQADSPSFVINVGTFKPKKGNAHIELPMIGHDYVYKINKYDITKYSDSLSLRGVDLTIGIYSEFSDSLKSSPYAFKIFMPPIVNQELQLAAELYHIRSDQKVQCIPFNYKNTNICSFAVIFDGFDINHKLILYPRSQYSHLTIYGKEIESILIERNNPSEIMEAIEDIYLNEKYRIQKKYIYLNKINSGKSYVFIVSEDNAQNIIEILSSTYKFHEDMNIYPNPSSAQIFAIENHNINLNFETTNDLLVNIVGISGTGNFYWGGQDSGKEQKYYISGENDRLSLTTLTYDEKMKLSPLKVQSISQTNTDGFIFYITYYPRGIMDQLKQDRNTEIHYRIVYMPLTYFADIDQRHSYSISFNFYDYTLTQNQNLTYDTSLFNIWATVISNETAIKAKINDKLRPKYSIKNCINGVFDAAFGTLFLSSNDIKKIYNDKNTPNLFLSIDKEKDKDIPEFNNLGIELSLHSDYLSKGNGFLPERVYFNGKINKADNKTLIYSLSTNEEKLYIILEYSSLSDKIEFVLTSDEKSYKNDDFSEFNIEKYNGRYIQIIKLDDYFFKLEKKLFLKIFTKEENLYEKIDTYIFKYYSAKDISSPYIKPFSEESQSKLKIRKDKNKNDTYIIKLYPLKYNDVSYYIKAVYKKGMVYEENIDSIAVSESPGKYIQINNPEYNNKDQIIFELNVSQEISYIKIMAKVNQEAQKYFYLYKPFDIEKDPFDNDDDDDNNKPPDNKDSKKDDSTLIIGLSVGGVLVVIVIILVVFIILYHRKNKDLLNQVNKISFAESGVKEKVDSNLLINDENELD